MIAFVRESSTALRHAPRVHRYDAPIGAAEAARLLRRLDWRFLLPDPHLRRVIHLGPRTGTLGRALAAYSDSVAGVGPEPGPRGHADLVVAESATRPEMEAAFSRLLPGGWVYWELRAGQALGSADRTWLHHCGISGIQTFWNCSGFENRRWLVPLDDPGALAMFLKRRITNAPASVLHAMAKLIARSRTLRRPLPVSVIGCRGTTAPSGSFVHRFVDRDGTLPARPYIIATPTFPSSRSVVFLMDPDAHCAPTLVAKVARAEADCEPLAREARNLRALHVTGSDLHAPVLVSHGVRERRAILTESAVGGRLMQPRLVRRRPMECLEAVLRWLEAFHLSTRTPACHLPGRVNALVTAQLKQLEPIVAQGPSAAHLLLRVRRETNRLQFLNVPLVFEHGDLSSPNLQMLDSGRVGVLDWELSDPRGLPALDLFFFLAFIAFARARATTPEQCVEAFRGAFFGRTAWANPYIARYAAAVGVPGQALKPLFLLCWSRYLSNLPGRMAWAVDRDLNHAELAQVRQDRYWHLWKYAAEHIDDLEYAS